MNYYGVLQKEEKIILSNKNQGNVYSNKYILESYDFIVHGQ